jgi:hypothetical protein
MAITTWHALAALRDALGNFPGRRSRRDRVASPLRGVLASEGKPSIVATAADQATHLQVADGEGSIAKQRDEAILDGLRWLQLRTLVIEDDLIGRGLWERGAHESVNNFGETGLGRAGR